LRLGHGPDSFGFLGAGLVGVSQLAARSVSKTHNRSPENAGLTTPALEVPAPRRIAQLTVADPAA